MSLQTLEVGLATSRAAGLAKAEDEARSTFPHRNF
jgi:hypothetical protein